MIPGSLPFSTAPMSTSSQFAPRMVSLPPVPQTPFVVPPGIILLREQNDALWAAFAANGNVPLTSAQVLAITGPAPVYPTTLPLNDGFDGALAADGFDLMFAT